jgi:hypothetical protein
MIQQDILDIFRLKSGKKVRLKDHDTGWAQTKELKELGKDMVKERSKEILDKNLEDLAKAQELLYADDRYAMRPCLQPRSNPLEHCAHSLSWCPIVWAKQAAQPFRHWIIAVMFDFHVCKFSATKVSIRWLQVRVPSSSLLAFPQVGPARS